MKKILILSVFGLLSLLAFSQCCEWRRDTIPTHLRHKTSIKYGNAMETVNVTNYYQQTTLKYSEDFINITKHINCYWQDCLSGIFFSPIKGKESYKEDTTYLFRIPQIKKSKKNSFILQVMCKHYLPIEEPDTLQNYFSDTSFPDNTFCRKKLQLSYILQKTGLEPIKNISDSTIRFVNVVRNGSNNWHLIYELKLIDNEIFMNCFFAKETGKDYEIINEKSGYLPQKN